MVEPCQIPSGYFIADVYLFMDALFNKNVFHPDQKKIPKETRSELAAEEAVKTKRCLQALRYLWRNAKLGSHCPRVQMLKDYLAPSPLQDRRRDQEPEEHQSSDSEGEGPADVDIEVEEHQSPVPSEDGGHETDEDPSGNEGHESDDEPRENEGHESDDEPREDEGHQSDGDPHEDEGHEGDDGSKETEGHEVSSEKGDGGDGEESQIEVQSFLRH